MERQPHVSTATLGGARAVGIVCAALFFAPVVLSLAFPDWFLFAPYHRTYERLVGTILGALILGVLDSMFTFLDAGEAIQQTLYGMIVLALAWVYARVTAAA